jgi:hypothetical protein
MKIKSRPSASGNLSAGNGVNTLNLTDEQLEVIMSLMCHVRLGQGTYSQAIGDLMSDLEEEFGSDIFTDATDNVPIGVTIEDQMGMIMYKTNGVGVDEFVTLEV